MKINEIYEILTDYAPICLSNELVALENGYDNSGIIAHTEKDINTVVFTLDLTKKAVETAIKTGAKLIVTHHPAIYAPISSLSCGMPLLTAMNSEIGVISLHLNLDTAKYGIDYYLAKGLGAKNEKIVTPLSITGCGYGRIFETDTTALDVEKLYRKEFSTDKTVLYGDKTKSVKSVASFCGSGLSEREIDLCASADLYVSSDIKHHVILYATEKGKAVLDVSHYSSEAYGFIKFYENVKQKLNGLNAIYVANDVML